MRKTPAFLHVNNYLAFMAPVYNYFVVMWYNRYLFLYEWAVPIALAFLSISNEIILISRSLRLTLSVTLLGSLMAFSLALLTLILTFNERIISTLKTRMTDVVARGKSLSLYQLMFTNTAYSIVVEGILTMFTMFFMIHASWMSWLSVSVTILFTAQVILINLRTITNVYLVYINPDTPLQEENMKGEKDGKRSLSSLPPHAPEDIDE